jgi:hypothetical protein
MWIIGGTFKCQTAGMKISVMLLKFRKETRDYTDEYSYSSCVLTSVAVCVIFVGNVNQVLPM